MSVGGDELDAVLFVKMPRELKARLRRYADRQHVDVSSLVRLLLLRAVTEQEEARHE